MPAKLKEVKDKYKGMRQDVEVSNKVYQKVQQGAKRAALAEVLGKILIKFIRKLQKALSVQSVIR